MGGIVCLPKGPFIDLTVWETRSFMLCVAIVPSNPDSEMDPTKRQGTFAMSRL